MSCDFEEDRSCLFIKGFPANFSVILPEVRSFFQERVGKCSIEMNAVSKDKRCLYVVVGFDSPEVAADVLERFDGKHILGHKVKMSYWRVRTETTMKDRQEKSLCHDIDIDARNKRNRSYVEDNEVHTRCTVGYAREQGSWNDGSRESTHSAKQADTFNRPPRCGELTWADTHYHASNDYLLQFKCEEEWYKEGLNEQNSLYHDIRNGRDVNPGGKKGSYDVAENHQLGIRRGSYYQEDAWQKSETHRKFGLDIVNNQYFVDFERDIKDYELNKGFYGEQFNYNSRQEKVDRSFFGNERSMSVEEATRQSVSFRNENRFYQPDLVKGEWSKEGLFNKLIDDQTKNTRPQFEQANARTKEKDLEYDPRDSRPPVIHRKPWSRRQAEVPPNRSRRGLSDLSPGATPRDLPEVAAVAGPRPSRRFIPTSGREAEEHLEGIPRSGGWSRHSRNQFRDKNRPSASPGSQQNLIKNNRRRQSPTSVGRTVETSSSTNPEESLQVRKRRRSLSAERDFHLNSPSDWNRDSYTNDLKRHESVATRRSLKHSPKHFAPSTGRETRRYSPKEKGSLPSGRTASAYGSKGIVGDGNSKRLEKLSPRGRPDNDLRNLLILRKQAKQASVGGGMSLNNNNKRETKSSSSIVRGSKSPLTSPCSQSSPESRSTARRINRKRYKGDDTDTKTKHNTEISKTHKRQLKLHVSQDASSCSSMASKEGRNNKLLKDSDELALSDEYHRKEEKPPGSRRNLLKEQRKGINSPNKLKSNNGHKADTKRTDRLLNDLAPVCLSEVNVPLGRPIETLKTFQGPQTKAVLYSAFEGSFSNEIYDQERNSTVDVGDDCMESLQGVHRFDKEEFEGWRTIVDASQTHFPENSSSYSVGALCGPGDKSMELNVAEKYYPPITVTDYTRQEESFRHDIQTCESYLDSKRKDDLFEVKKIADFCIESNSCHRQEGICSSTCPHLTALQVDAANNATDNGLSVLKESSGFCENASFLVNDCFSERARTPSFLPEQTTVCEKNGEPGGIGGNTNLDSRYFHQHSETRTLYKTSEESSFTNPGLLPFCPKDVNKNAWESDLLSQYSANCQQIDMEISSNEEFPIRNSNDIRTTTPFIGNSGATEEGLTYGVNDSCERAVQRELTINSSSHMMDDCHEVDMEFSSDEATQNPSPRITKTDVTFDLLEPKLGKELSKTGNVVHNFDITRQMQTLLGMFQTEEHYQKTEWANKVIVSNKEQEEHSQIYTTQQGVHNTESANFDAKNPSQELYLARDASFNHYNPKEEVHSVEYPVCCEAFDIDGFHTALPYQESSNNKESGIHKRSEEGVYCGERDNAEKELYSTEGIVADESNTEPDVFRREISGMDVDNPDQEPYIPEGAGLNVHVLEQEVYKTKGSGCDSENMKRQQYSNEDSECVSNSGNCKGVYRMKDPAFGRDNQEVRFDANDLGGETRCFQNVTSKLYEKVSDPLQSLELKNDDLCPFKGEALNAETDAKAVDWASDVFDNSHNVNGETSSWDVSKNRDVPTSNNSALCYNDKNSEYRSLGRVNWLPSDKRGKSEECRVSSPRRPTWKGGEVNSAPSVDKQQETIDNWRPNSPTSSTWKSEEHQSPAPEDSGNCSPYSQSSATWKTSKDRLCSPNDNAKPNQHEKSKDCNLFATVCLKKKGDKNHCSAENDTSGTNDCKNYAPNRSLWKSENYLHHSKVSDDDVVAVPQRISPRRLRESKKENITGRDWDGDLNSNDFPHQVDVGINSDDGQITETLKTGSEHSHFNELTGCTKEKRSIHESFSWKNAKTNESIGDVNFINSTNNCDDKAGNKSDAVLGTQNATCIPCDTDNIKQSLKHHSNIRSGSSQMQNEPHSTTITDNGTRGGDNMPACHLVNKPLSNSVINEALAKVVEETVKNVPGTKSCSVINENAGGRSSDDISSSLPREPPIQSPISRTTDVNEICYHEDTVTSSRAGVVDSSQSTLRAMDIDIESSDDPLDQSFKCHWRMNDGKTQSDSQITFKDYNKDKSASLGDSLNNLASSLMDCCPSLGKNSLSQGNAASFNREISCEEINTASKATSPDNTTLLKDSTDTMAPDYRIANRLSASPNSSNIAGEIRNSLENTQHNAEAASVEPSWEHNMDSSDSSVSDSNRNLLLGDDTSEKVGSVKTGCSFSRLMESPQTVIGNEPLTAGQEHATAVNGGSENKVQGTTFFSVQIPHISRPKTAESACDLTSSCAIKRTLPGLHVVAAAQKKMKLKLATVKESDCSTKSITVDVDTCERLPVSATVFCTEDRLTKQWNPLGNSSTIGSHATLPNKGFTYSSRQEHSSKVTSHAGNLHTMSSAPTLVCETNTKSQPGGREHSAQAPSSLSVAPRVVGIEAKSCSTLNKIDTNAKENTSKDGSTDSTSCTRTENQLTALKMKRLQKKKEEIEEVYRRECRAVINVVKLLVSNDPRLESLLQNAVRRSLQEMGRRCVQELEKHVRLRT